jgi:hypothetical protein
VIRALRRPDAFLDLRRARSASSWIEFGEMLLQRGIGLAVSVVSGWWRMNLQHHELVAGG